MGYDQEVIAKAIAAGDESDRFYFSNEKEICDWFIQESVAVFSRNI